MPSARRVNWAKFRVAAVAVAALIILSVLCYLLTGGTLLEAKASLYLYISDATGLGPDSPVRLNGIGIGKVESVQLSESKDPKRAVRLTMRVERDSLPGLTIDSVAQISSETLAGDRFVDISSGRNPISLKPGGELLFREQPDYMKSVDLTQLEKQLAVIGDMMTDIEQGRGRVGELVRGRTMYDDLRGRIAELHTALHDAVSTEGAVGSALYSDELYQRIRKPFADLDAALSKIQSGQGQAGQFLRDDAQHEKIRASLADLRQTVASLRNSDFFANDQLYESVNRGIMGFIATVDQANVNPLFSTTQVYDNLNGFVVEMQHTVKDFRENPRKYMRIVF
jgi:phospholipid/cholesterol/gamma-HCH transport system substrate-binding protein